MSKTHEALKQGEKKGRQSNKLNLINYTKNEKEMGITLIALIITILFSYDEKIKNSNSKGFLLLAI